MLAEFTSDLTELAERACVCWQSVCVLELLLILPKLEENWCTFSRWAPSLKVRVSTTRMDFVSPWVIILVLGFVEFTFLPTSRHAYFFEFLLRRVGFVFFLRSLFLYTMQSLDLTKTNKLGSARVWKLSIGWTLGRMLHFVNHDAVADVCGLMNHVLARSSK